MPIAPKMPNQSEAPDPKDEERILLPSGRVASFRLPRVGELMDLQDQALIEASPDRGKTSNGVIAVAIKKMVLRKLLSGISERPVQPIYTDRFDPEAFRRTVVAGAAHDEVALSAEDIESRVQGECVEREDSVAICASANLVSVDELCWDEGLMPDGRTHYLKTAQAARVGSTEAQDWMALNMHSNVLAGRLIGGVTIDPKVGKRAARLMRALVG